MLRIYSPKSVLSLVLGSALSIIVASIVFSHPIHAQGVNQHPYRWARLREVNRDVYQADLKAIEILRILTENSQNLRDMPAAQYNRILTLANEGLRQALPTAKLSVLTAIYQKSSAMRTRAGQNLRRMMAEYVRGFNDIHGRRGNDRIGHTQSALAGRDRPPEFDEFFSHFDTPLVNLIRGRILQGAEELNLVVDLFELLSAQGRMASIFLIYSHGFAVATHVKEIDTRVAQRDRKFPLPRTSWNSFMLALHDLKDALDAVKFVFPSIPSLEPNGVRDEDDDIDRSKVEAFRNSFKNFFDELPARAHGQSLYGSLMALSESVRYINNYKRHAFPEPFSINNFQGRGLNPAQLNARVREQNRIAKENDHLTNKLISNPEYAECYSLAIGRNLTHLFEGPPCDAVGLARDLQQYIQFNRSSPGYGLYRGILNTIAREKRLAGNRRVSVPRVRRAFHTWFDGQYFSPTVRAQRDALTASIFNNRNRLRTALPNGRALHTLVSSALARHNLDPLLGIYATWDPSVTAAMEILGGLRFHRIISPAARGADNRPVPATFIASGKRIERVTSTSSCEWALDENQRSNAPYTVITENLMPFDRTRGKWTTWRPSSHSAEQAIFAHDIKVDRIDRNQIQQRKDEVLAGAIRYEFMRKALVAAVWAKRMLGESLGQKTLRGLGVTFQDRPMDTLFRQRYTPPTWNKIVEEADANYDNSILAKFKETYAPKTDPETGQPIPRRFTIPANAPAAQVESMFRTRYKEEMTLTAREWRKWQEELDDHSIDQAAADSSDELCELFRLPPQICGHPNIGVALRNIDGIVQNQVTQERRRAWRAINRRFITVLIPQMERGILARVMKREWERAGRTVNTASTAWRNEFNARIREFEATPDQLVEELAAHRGPVVFQFPANEIRPVIRGGETVGYGPGGRVIFTVSEYNRYFRDIPPDERSNEFQYTPRGRESWGRLTNEERDRWGRYMRFFGSSINDQTARRWYSMLVINFARLARIYDLVKSAHDRKLAFLRKAVNSFKYLFPALDLDVRLSGNLIATKAFRHFDGDTDDFERIMRAYLRSIISQIHRMMREQRVQKILEEIGTDLVHMDGVMRAFPDLKGRLCELYDEWDWATIRRGVVIAAIPTAIPHPIIAAGATGIALYFSWQDAVIASRRFKESKLRELATLTQVTYGTFLTNRGLMQAMEDRATAKWVQAGIDSLLAVSLEGPLIYARWGLVKRAFGREAKFYRRVFSRVRSTVGRNALTENRWTFIGKLPLRMTAATARLVGAGLRRNIISPATRWKLLQVTKRSGLLERMNEPIAQFGLFSRNKKKYLRFLRRPIAYLNRGLGYANRAIRWVNTGRAQTNFRGYLHFWGRRLSYFKDLLMDPFFVARREMRLWPGRFVTGAALFGMTYHVYSSATRAWYQAPREAIMARLENDPERHQRVLDLVRRELITPEQIDLVMRLDDEHRVPYLQEVQRMLGATFLQRLRAANGRMFPITNEEDLAFLRARRNEIITLRNNVQARIAALPRREEFSPLREVLQWSVEDLELILLALNQTVGN